MREISTQSGTRRYKVFIPSGYDGSKALPLVVMLHGCTQDPDDIARGTRLNESAEDKSVLVAYAGTGMILATRRGTRESRR
jgi:poly(3-hydroxybutyrate) depolymerase